MKKSSRKRKYYKMCLDLPAWVFAPTGAKQTLESKVFKRWYKKAIERAIKDERRTMIETYYNDGTGKVKND